MSKVTIEGYVINIDDRSIDFSNVENFDVTQLDYIYDPNTGTYYYARPRPPVDWGTWDGKVFTLSPAAVMPRLRPTSRLICLSDPPPSVV